MQISDVFKNTIKDIFYDKHLEIWSTGIITDDEGSVIGNGKQEKKDEFLGNFQFTTREYIQQEYGKEIQANAIVTCKNTVAEIGDILVYNNENYEIKSIIVYDSHITLLVKNVEEKEVASL